MWFPQNPKVLVIDDQIKEVEPILKLFSRYGISYIYYDGGEKALPKRPFTTIRIVILDIDLEGRTKGLDDKSKASSLAEYLNQLINIKNAFLYILFWTNHPEIIPLILKYLNIASSAVIEYKNLEKPSKSELKKISLKKLEKILFSDLKSEVFAFFLNWENQLQEKVSKYTNAISNIAKSEIDDTHNWDYAMKSILSKLACSYLGRDKIDISERSYAISYATAVLNSGFKESLLNSKIFNTSISLSNTSTLSLETISKLNHILFFEDVTNAKIIENGKIFYKKDASLLELLKNDKTIKKFISYGTSKLVSVVLTPSCDIAHQKILHKMNAANTDILFEMHRLLYGVQIEIDKEKYNDKKLLELLNNSLPEKIYLIQPFLLNDKVCIILFHFDTISSKKITLKRQNYKIILKESLAFDLQTKLANHVNHLGNSMLEYKKN